MKKDLVVNAHVCNHPRYGMLRRIINETRITVLRDTLHHARGQLLESTFQDAVDDILNEACSKEGPTLTMVQIVYECVHDAGGGGNACCISRMLADVRLN